MIKDSHEAWPEEITQRGAFLTHPQKLPWAPPANHNNASGSAAGIDQTPQPKVLTLLSERHAGLLRGVAPAPGIV